MEYTVHSLAKISGITERTLRYYDQIGLLTPGRVRSNGYRIYSQMQVDLLQQILFFRELGMSLEEIKDIMYSPTFDRHEALQNHLSSLQKRKARLELLIENVSKTIRAMKGEAVMSDTEKFDGFKQKLIDENERDYGAEIRQKYGDETVNASNNKLKGMTQAQYAEAEKLSIAVNDTLKAAFEQGDPAGELAQKACDLHRSWLGYFWPEGMYSREAHLGLAEMYCDDERFKAYYEAIAPGCTEFFRDAMRIYCK